MSHSLFLAPVISESVSRNKLGGSSILSSISLLAIQESQGAPLAVSPLTWLRSLGTETHLVLPTRGSATLKYELDISKNTTSCLSFLATHTHSPKDVSAVLSSISFRTDGMIVVPCSMKTLAGIRMGYDNDLITRAASVTLKESRKLVLVARETPLSSIHLENMLEVTKAGPVIFPPVMTFYMRPKGVEDMVEQSVRRMVDLLDLKVGEDVEIEAEDEGRWKGFEWEEKKKDERKLIEGGTTTPQVF
ncbi:Phenylacrylic acid decarboxylase [Tothia fuscella]|uniref:Phenylacrylic acid decarboxylase n=1 Tax=Tothia fuscella TaxID=1048955 RepID=A0A9P4NPA5_9PEZI|nr:Phenylacrylic acid decarboxylase [Tothia fuscella]